ncbi:MAG: zf-TFIIB domain-containing protein [Pseudomonadota bacterium]
MPLMSSPIDGSPMREVERYGVKIDICPTSGGIWLDKGELEKIIMMIRQEALEEQAPPPPPTATYAEEYEEPRYQTREDRPRRRKRDSIFDNLMDIFD